MTTYRLHAGETACDSDDWGPPKGRFGTLLEALRASGVPVSLWRTDRYCPDEVFTFHVPPGVVPEGRRVPRMSILAPGVRDEFSAIPGRAGDAITERK